MLKQKIEDDLKEALKAKDAVRVSTLRLLKASIKNSEIAKLKELTEEEVIGSIKKEVKQRNDSIEEFKKGNRPDLVEKETQELNILKAYLPQEIGADQLREMVKEAIAETKAVSVKEMGLVIKAVMQKAKGSADGKIVSEIVKDELGKIN